MTQDTTLSFDVDVASKFLNRFNYSTTTIQLLVPESKPKPSISGKVLWNKSKGSSAVTFTGCLSQQSFLPDLYLLQNQHLGVFFMVNEGDGIIHEPATTVRSAKSVVKLTSLFIDTDKGHVSSILNFLKAKNIFPHIIVQSSPGRFHIYILIQHLPADSQHIKLWASLQKLFYSTDPLYDQSMHDVAKLLRIPGFYHTKKDPFKISVEYESFHEAYDLFSLCDTYKEELNLKHSAEQSAQNKPTRQSYAFPTQKIGSGGRHQALTSFVSHISNFTPNLNDLITAAVGFAHMHFEDPTPFLPNGTRYESDTLKICSDYVKLRDHEKIQIIEQHIEPIDQKPKRLTQEQKVSDAFYLPDEFYFNAPGLAGEIVKEICSTAPFPIPCFAFACTLGLLGTLKANTIRGFNGLAPVNYSLCFCATGGGKDYPQKVIQHTFKSHHLDKHINTSIRSDKGLLHFLETNDANALIIMDEVSEFLELIQSKNSEQYQQGLLGLLLKLYSLPPTFHSGFLGDRSKKPFILDNPTLNFVGFTQIEALKSALTSETILKGLLPRFLIFAHHGDKILNPASQAPAALNGFIKDNLKELIMACALSREESLNSQELIEDLTKASTEDRPLTAEEVKALAEEYLHKKESKIRKAEIPKVSIELDSKAEGLFNLFRNKMLDVENRFKNKGQYVGAAVVSRAAEHVARISLTLASVKPEEKIGAEVLQYAIDFIQSRIKGMLHLSEEHYSKSTISYATKDINKEVLRIADFVKDRLSGGVYPVPYRDIFIRFNVEDPTKMKAIINAAIECGYIIEVSSEVKKRGPAGRYFAIPKS